MYVFIRSGIFSFVSINDATDAHAGRTVFPCQESWSFASYKDILTRSHVLHSILVTLARTLVGTPLAVPGDHSACLCAFQKGDALEKAHHAYFHLYHVLLAGGLVPYYMVLKTTMGVLDHFIVYIFPIWSAFTI